MSVVWPPTNLARLASPHIDRTNLVAELFDREVFHGATFADLPARPQLRIHATDIALGTRFTFSDRDFALLESDLGSYPIAHACAASAAFPVLLSPMTLLNHGEKKTLEELFGDDAQYRGLVRNSRKDVWADLQRKRREHYNDKENRYVHLSDGGIVDNQGLESVLRAFETGGLIQRRLTDSRNPLRRLIIINVNAGVSPNNDVAKVPSSPGVRYVVEHTMVASMDILSAKRWMRIREHTQELYKPVIDGADIPALRRLEMPYTIEVSFRNVLDDGLRLLVNELPTSFALDASQLELIDVVVPPLLLEDPEMQRLRESILQP